MLMAHIETYAVAIFRGVFKTYQRSTRSKGTGAATTAHPGAPRLSTLYPNRHTKQPTASEAKIYTRLSTR
jgi:hypothetical protein